MITIKPGIIITVWSHYELFSSTKSPSASNTRGRTLLTALIYPTELVSFSRTQPVNRDVRKADVGRVRISH